jgi:branched-chain amino acid transport system substrate-binding protein
MKKILGILLVVLFFSACKTEKKETITIGAILPLTGGYAQYGNYMRQGMELALEDAINSGKIISNEIQLIFEDSQADPKKSVSAINKLIEINLVTACIPATSGVTLAIKPIANKNEVILVNATAISPQIEDSSDYVYSIIPDAAFEGKFLAEIGYSKLGKKKCCNNL